MKPAGAYVCTNVQETEPGVAYAARIFERMAEDEDLASEDRRRQRRRIRDSARFARFSLKVKRGSGAAWLRPCLRTGVFTF